ncbi:MAG TPA: hydrolase, partial [Herpetosiphonaceae bacterium]
MTIDLERWEPLFERLVRAEMAAADAAHDLAHIHRVVAVAKALAAGEGADPAVVVPAAWLHDCVSVPKDSPIRAQASRLAADRAAALLAEHGYPAEHLDGIRHAIAAHSFSAKIEPATPEARVV